MGFVLQIYVIYNIDDVGGNQIYVVSEIRATEVASSLRFRVESVAVSRDVTFASSDRIQITNTLMTNQKIRREAIKVTGFE